MKLEIIKETEKGEKPWYTLEIDGRHIKGTYNFDTIMSLYKEIKETDGACLKATKEILVSEEINVNL